MQGDLHNPKQADVTMFRQRRALSFREQTNVPKNMVKPYEWRNSRISSSPKRGQQR